MGHFYVNISTRKVTAKEIVKFLKVKSLAAFVIGGPDDYCTIYEEGCDAQDTDYLSSMLSEISSRFSCPAIGILNHDDDILAYELWANGKMVDSYDSWPGYFEGDETRKSPVGGNAQVLSEVIGDGRNVQIIEKTLRASREDEGFLFAVERHQALAEAVGLPPHTVGFGFKGISEGEVPEGVYPGNILRSHTAASKVVSDFVFNDPEWKELEIKGNQHFYAGRYSEAIDFYKQAIEMGKTQLATDQNKNIFLLQIYNMHAECNIRTGNIDHAYHDLEEVINLANGIERLDHIGSKNYWLTNATVG